MSISNFILKIIDIRRKREQRNFSGPIGEFFRDGGNELLYKYLNLNTKSIVIDGGCYLGDFTKEILIRFGSRVLSFEPLKKEYKELICTFKKNKLVHLYNKALYDSNKKTQITLDGLNSSILSSKETNKKKIIKTFDIANIFKRYKKIDLLKLNVEGSEYNILLSLIKRKRLNKIKSYLIQFHPNSNSHQTINEIRKNFLKEGFKQVFNYNSVWEYWSK
jgi:FkbM family methyltransferase